MRRIKLVLAALVVMVASFTAFAGPAMADNRHDDWNHNNWNHNNWCCYYNSYYNNSYFPWWGYWIYPSWYGYNTSWWGW